MKGCLSGFMNMRKGFNKFRKYNIKTKKINSECQQIYGKNE